MSKIIVIMREPGKDNIGAHVDYTKEEMADLGKGPMVTIATDDGLSGGSVMVPLGVLSVLMAQIMNAKARGIITPDNDLVGFKK